METDETGTQNEEEKKETKLDKLNALLILNKAYQEVIGERLRELNRRLQVNLHQQNEITLKLRKSVKVKPSTANRGGCGENASGDLSRIKGNYFLDRYQSEPDANAVTIQMRQFVYFNYMPQFKSEWTLEFRRKLKQSVVNDTLRMIRTPHQNKIKLLEEKFYTLKTTYEKNKDHSTEETVDKKDMSAVQKMLREANSQLTRLELMSEDQILKQVDAEKVDWLKIAKVDLSGNWSATECRLVWMNVCNPIINQSKWTPNETNQLVDLARKHREKNWQDIANELNTNRSPFLCMKRYHEKTALKYCKRDWTEEEVKKLIEQAETHRIGFYVPYNYLCYLNGTRDRTSVYNCHLKRDPYLNHGKWSAEEKRMFDEAICFFAERNWQEISEYVGTRTAMQCKERYENKYMNPEKYKEWTVEEDQLLLAACEQYDKQWSKIAAALFPERTDHALLFRYTKLATWREQNDWFNSLSPQVQDFVMLLYGKEKNGLDGGGGDEESPTLVVPRPPKFLVANQNFQSLQQMVHEKQDTIAEFIVKLDEEQKLNTHLLANMGLPPKLINRVVGRFKRKMKRKYKGKDVVVSPVATNATSSIKERLKERVVRVTHQAKANVPSQLSNVKKRVKTMKSNNLDKQTKISISLSFKVSEYQTASVRTESRTIKQILLASSSSDTLLFSSAPINVSASISTSQIERRQERTPKRAIKSRPETETLVRRASKKICTENNNNSGSNCATTSTSRPLVDQTSSNLNILLAQAPSLVAASQPPLDPSEKLIVELSSIEDGTKIPCLNEMAKEFKYLYSLKVDKSKPDTSKYFQKYKIVKVKELLVAVKPMNSNIQGEYFNETRLESIEKALKKAKLME